MQEWKKNENKTKDKEKSEKEEKKLCKPIQTVPEYTRVNMKFIYRVNEWMYV